MKRIYASFIATQMIKFWELPEMPVIKQIRHLGTLATNHDHRVPAVKPLTKTNNPC